MDCPADLLYSRQEIAGNRPAIPERACRPAFDASTHQYRGKQIPVKKKRLLLPGFVRFQPFLHFRPVFRRLLFADFRVVIVHFVLFAIAAARQRKVQRNQPGGEDQAANKASHMQASQVKGDEKYQRERHQP
jgi:hypothetical protein